MFANRILHYGGSGGGIRRGLIWTNGVSKPGPEYETLYTPNPSNVIPWYIGESSVYASSDWFDFEKIEIENQRVDGKYVYGFVDQYGYNFYKRSQSNDYTQIASNGTSIKYERAFSRVGSLYRNDYRNQIPYRLVGEVGLYYDDEISQAATEDDLRSILETLSSYTPSPSSTILVPGTGNFGPFGTYDGVPIPEVFEVDTQEYLNKRDTNNEITLDKGRAFHSEFINGNIQMTGFHDTEGNPALYLRAINFLLPRKLSADSSRVVLDKIERYRINTQAEPYGWIVPYISSPTTDIDVSSFVPDISAITGVGYFRPALRPGLHYVPLDIYYITGRKSSSAGAVYGMVFKGYLSFFENRKIITP